MASAAQTLGGSGKEFEADTDERIATLLIPGGKVIMTAGSGQIGVNVNGATVVLTNPAGVGGRILDLGDEVKLPATCRSFSFKGSASGQYLTYEPPV